MSTEPTVYEILSLVLTLIIGVCVPAVAYWVSRLVNKRDKAANEEEEAKQRASQEKRMREEENRRVAEEKRKELLDNLGELTESFTNISAELSKVKLSVHNELSEHSESVKTEIQVALQNMQGIEKLARFNSKYTHAVGELVIALADGIHNNKLNGNITAAIDKYRKFQSDTMKTMADGGGDN